MTEHTPERIAYKKHGSYWRIMRAPDEITIGRAHDEFDARRFCATWNACQSIPTAALEAGVVAEMREALDGLAKDCPHCGGEGVIYLMEDETEIGQPPGSSGRDCGRCAEARAALAKADGKEGG